MSLGRQVQYLRATRFIARCKRNHTKTSGYISFAKRQIRRLERRMGKLETQKAINEMLESQYLDLKEYDYGNLYHEDHCACEACIDDIWEEYKFQQEEDYYDPLHRTKDEWEVLEQMACDDPFDNSDHDFRCSCETCINDIWDFHERAENMFPLETWKVLLEEREILKEMEREELEN